MTAYYNEHDPFAAAWLRELIAEGLIAPGDVDERSIEDVKPDDLRPYAQCHFFAGIGIWSLALRCAGWSDDRPIWTGSCPCQPFSTAGKGAGFADERHLWPAFDWLIRQCAPGLVLGEQVASKDGLAWLDAVQADMEAAGYAFGAVDLCAAGFGAPHIRQRLFWMADTMCRRAWHDSRESLGTEATADGSERHLSGQRLWLGFEGSPLWLADDDGAGSQRRQALPERAGQCAAGPNSLVVGLADSTRSRWREECTHGGRSGGGDSPQGVAAGFMPGRDAGRLGYPAGPAREWQPRGISGKEAPLNGERCTIDGSLDLRPEYAGTSMGERPNPTNSLWRAADWLGCTDGKWRPVEPGTFPLAHAGAFRNCVGLLRGAGNSINLAVAQGFIVEVMSYLEGKELLDD